MKLDERKLEILRILAGAHTQLSAQTIHNVLVENEGNHFHLGSTLRNLGLLRKQAYVKNDAFNRVVGVPKGANESKLWFITQLGKQVLLSHDSSSNQGSAITILKKKVEHLEDELSHANSRLTEAIERLMTLVHTVDDLQEDMPEGRLDKMVDAMASTCRSQGRDIRDLQNKHEALKQFANTHVHVSDTAQLIINAKKAGAKTITIDI